MNRWTSVLHSDSAYTPTPEPGPLRCRSHSPPPNRAMVARLSGAMKIIGRFENDCHQWSLMHKMGHDGASLSPHRSSQPMQISAFWMRLDLLNDKLSFHPIRLLRPRWSPLVPAMSSFHQSHLHPNPWNNHRSSWGSKTQLGFSVDVNSFLAKTFKSGEFGRARDVTTPTTRPQVVRWFHQSCHTSASTWIHHGHPWSITAKFQK